MKKLPDPSITQNHPSSILAIFNFDLKFEILYRKIILSIVHFQLEAIIHHGAHQ